MVPAQSGAQPDRIAARVNGACVEKTVPRFKNGGSSRNRCAGEQSVPHKTVPAIEIGARYN
jgi:hypothetical protein